MGLGSVGSSEGTQQGIGSGGRDLKDCTFVVGSAAGGRAVELAIACQDQPGQGQVAVRADKRVQDGNGVGGRIELVDGSQVIAAANAGGSIEEAAALHQRGSVLRLGSICAIEGSQDGECACGGNFVDRSLIVGPTVARDPVEGAGVGVILGQFRDALRSIRASKGVQNSNVACHIHLEHCTLIAAAAVVGGAIEKATTLDQRRGRVGGILRL